MDCDPQTNPDACLKPLVEEVTPDLMKLANGSASSVGRGGMASKLEAATKACRFGIPMIIARGKIPHIIPRVMEGELCGTLILPAKERISARKHWMRYNLVPEGAIHVDEGAARALTRGGISLLPVGVIEVEGHFEHGAAVCIKDPSGNDVALGQVNYSSEELNKIKGHQASEIDWILGYRSNDEAIHADNLVLMET